MDTKLDKPIKAKIVDSLGEAKEREEKELQFVGQLRLDYTLSLLNMGLARIGRVGIETDEVIRQRYEFKPR